MRTAVALFFRQLVLVALAALAYFGVRGLTEGEIAAADRRAESLLSLERHLGLDFEQGLQDALGQSDLLVNVANWVYIWGHWPVVIATLAWLWVRHQDDFLELRNAMFISGAIGLVIFATFPVTPPRLLDIGFIDTVTERSNAYRFLQPSFVVNKYAAMPSLHFGWNLLVALFWARHCHSRWVMAGVVFMPIAMAYAVVATANHWTLDVFVGGMVALAGLLIERLRRRAIAADHGFTFWHPSHAT